MCIRSIGVGDCGGGAVVLGCGPCCAGRLVEITGSDQMKFSVMAITAKPGELLHVRRNRWARCPRCQWRTTSSCWRKALIRRRSPTQPDGGDRYIPAQFNAKMLGVHGLADPVRPWM